MGGDSSTLASALVSSRDGIANFWTIPGTTPTHLAFEDATNLARWGTLVRAVDIDFELFTQLGFSSDTKSNMARVWHLSVTAPTADGVAPKGVYQPLFSLTRPSETTFKKQVNLLGNYADLRPDRIDEVITQLGGAQAFLASIAYLNPERTKYTLELLAAAVRVATFVEMRLKHATACRRPIEYTPQLQPMISTPLHGTYPSGHATETFMMAIVLWNLIKGSGAYGDTLWLAQLLQLAARVAINRQVAGVHTPVETAAGTLLGLTLGGYLVQQFNAVATPAGRYDAWHFDGANYAPDDLDYDWTDYFDMSSATQAASAAASGFATKQAGAGGAGRASAILDWLWKKAAAEWS